MNKKERVIYIIETLELLFPKVPIPLDHKDSYTLLIAVLLSAQSTDIGVNKITPILFSKADSPSEMVKLTIDEIRNIIRPVGLSPMKSKAIHGLSQILIDKHKISYYNYGLKLNLNKKIFYNQNYCSLPYPLVIGYVLSLLSNNPKNQLYFAGLDGFDLNNPDSDNSKEILDYFLKKVFQKKPISLTSNKYRKLFKYQIIWKK